MQIKKTLSLINGWAEEHPVKAELSMILATILIAVTILSVGGATSRADERWKPTDWHPMAISELSYACDPVLGVVVKRPQFRDGSGLVALSVTSYTQMTVEQRARMCDGR